MKMKFVLGLFLFSVSLGSLSQGAEPTKKSKQEDKNVVAIRDAIDSYVKAFNAADAEGVADHWSENAVYIRADSGEKVTGRKAIARVFREIFADNQPKLRVKVDSIRLVTAEVAIEDGTAFVASASGDEDRSTYTAVHVKGQDGWKLDSVRETDTPAEAATAVGQQRLGELEWMLGNWVDVSDDATVEYSANWAKHNSFIVRLFKVSVPNVEGGELEGTQIIGWDAASKSIRSWVFDSAGGFSEGTWLRKGDAWVIKSSGYVVDGRRTSSVGTLKQIDENTLTWRMTNRVMDGEKLPDIDEVKIVRK